MIKDYKWICDRCYTVISNELTESREDRNAKALSGLLIIVKTKKRIMHFCSQECHIKHRGAKANQGNPHDQ